MFVLLMLHQAGKAQEFTVHRDTNAAVASAQALPDSSEPFLSNKFSFGGALGTPGLLNFLLGYFGTTFGVRLEAGCFEYTRSEPAIFMGQNLEWEYYASVAGVELAVAWRLWSSANWRIDACSIGQFGASQDMPPFGGTSTWFGPGLALEADYYGAYAEIGFIPITFNLPEWQGPTGSTRRTMPIVQLGYFH